MAGVADVDIVMLRLQSERMHGSFVPRRASISISSGSIHKLRAAKRRADHASGPDEPGVEIGSEIADDIDRSLIAPRSRWGSGPHGLPRDLTRDLGKRPAAAVTVDYVSISTGPHLPPLPASGERRPRSGEGEGDAPGLDSDGSCLYYLEIIDRKAAWR